MALENAVIYVVLGMHKSGTTVVSRTLHASGINMGEFDEELGYDEGNQYERVAAQSINKRLLAGYLSPIFRDRIMRRLWPRMTADGRVFNLDSLARVSGRPTAASTDLKREMHGLIGECGRRYQDWGFKDPRTCLTYPLWAEALPAHKIIVVFRNYQNVLERRQRFRRMPRPLGLPTVWRTLRNWTDYNQAIVESLEGASQPWLVLCYDELMTSTDPLKRLEAFVERPLTDMRDASLYRIRPDSARKRSVLVDGLASALGGRPKWVLSRLSQLADVSSRRAGAEESEARRESRATDPDTEAGSS